MQGKYGNLDASVVSYGPCQTPTLNFCVERHQKIASFQPEPFWVVRPQVSKGGQRITPEWGRGRLFDLDVAQVFKKLVSDAQHLKVGYKFIVCKSRWPDVTHLVVPETNKD